MEFMGKYSDIHDENAGLIDKAGTSNRRKPAFSLRAMRFNRYFDAIGGCSYSFVNRRSRRPSRQKAALPQAPSGAFRLPVANAARYAAYGTLSRIIA